MWTTALKIAGSAFAFILSLITGSKANADKQAGINEQVIADDDAAQKAVLDHKEVMDSAAKSGDAAARADLYANWQRSDD